MSTTTAGARFAPGSLVRARGRDWVVLPESTADLLVLRGLGGADDEVAGVLVDLEDVEPATFPWPDPERSGDHLGARLLADAARLGFRSSAGPFRSFGAISVEPRPYQLVPLLMALRLDPVRLLIADDVGIGKTIEAALVAKELLVTGTATRLAVLCPPHLAEQWQAELATKFHIHCELVLASTAPRLERTLGPGQSVFEVHPFTIVSTDFVKSERRRDEFVRSAPDLVIVDEAHTCAADERRRGAAHQRYRLLRQLADDPARHLLLVTATPHSGNEGAFRSLVGLLGASFADVDDHDGVNERTREQLERHLVQRRRADIQNYLEEDTPFPERLELPEEEGRYQLTDAYRNFLDEILAWARETVRDSHGERHRQRVRWWSVLALLRSLASSPAAAAATLRNRAAAAATSSVEEADEVGRRSVLDIDEADDVTSPDAVPGADPTPPEDEAPDGAEHAPTQGERARLAALADRAETLTGQHDAKLAHATRLLQRLVADGYNPIVFCRFIPTADYVAGHLERALGGGVAVASVTGLLAPEEREARVAALGHASRRVLVATDCLSEGINLQESFDAVIHYDLPWNPTRLEQREGRVDRYGQPSPTVRMATIYGTDNVIDEVVLDVLLRKHKKIRSELGVSIPVPGSNDEFIESVLDRLLSPSTLQLRLFDAASEGSDADLRDRFFAEWERAADRERRSRTRYAQTSIKFQEVAQELRATRQALGSSAQVARFLRDALRALGGTFDGEEPFDRSGPAVRISLRALPQRVHDYLGHEDNELFVRFEPTLRPGETYVSRTHPLVANLAAYLLDAALDPESASPAARCGVVRTRDVSTTTSVVVTRLRFELSMSRRERSSLLLVEDLAVAGFEHAPEATRPIPAEQAEKLLDAVPSANVDPAQRVGFLRTALEQVRARTEDLEALADERARALVEAHARVRSGARSKVRPLLPVDVLGVYLYLPE